MIEISTYTVLLGTFCIYILRCFMLINYGYLVRQKSTEVSILEFSFKYFDFTDKKVFGGRENLIV